MTSDLRTEQYHWLQKTIKRDLVIAIEMKKSASENSGTDVFGKKDH